MTVSVHYKSKRRSPFLAFFTPSLLDTAHTCRHTNNDEIYVCHTSCAIQNGGSLTSYLQTVSAWVSANPNEVISIIIVNIDNLPATSFAQSFASAGLDQFAFAPNSGVLAFGDWPTLGSMIDSGKRVVVFMDNTADFNQVPWLMDQFSNMFEDAYGAVFRFAY